MSRTNLEQAGNAGFAESDLLDYWLLIKKHRGQIFKLTLMVTLLSMLVVFQMTPVYRSTALLLIESSHSRVMTLKDMYGGRRESRDEFNSQVQILHSRPVAETVVRKLKLLESAMALPAADGKKLTQEQVMNSLVGQIQGWLSITPIKMSRIVKISFNSPDRELTAKVANAAADAYIDNDLEARAEMRQKASGWLMQRIDSLRIKLENSEKTLQHFRERENIVDNKGVALSGSGKQFNEVSTNLVTSQMRLAEAKNAFNQVKDQDGQSVEVLGSLPAVLRDPTVQKMKQADAEATRKVNELKSRYAHAHPKMIAANTEQKSAHEALTQAINAVINGISREYEIAQANAGAAANAKEQIKAEIQSLTRKESRLSMLQREVDSNKQLYDSYVNRAKETEAAANLQSTAGRLIDPAMVPFSPIKPQKFRMVVFSMLLGFLFSVVLVFLLDYLDSTVHSVADVEQRLRMGVLGSVRLLEQQEGGAKAALAFMDDPNSAFSESIRDIRTSVLLSAIDEPHRVVMVTSTVPGEGKTTIAINLAFALGQVKKVLIVDADMRRPMVGKTMGEEMVGGMGLVDFLAESATLEECIRSTPNPNVFVLPAGKRFNSPLELISSQKFSDTLDKLKSQFDVVLIDCPPLKPVSDSLVISRYANAVLYVIKTDGAPHQLINAALKRLDEVNAPLLGVVLNQVDFKKADRYGHYSYQYQYAYGQEPSKPQRSFMGIKI
ncbi:MAG: polysaccharide biosynthesis tyrosine autokinase [Gallionellaceae bacterium]